MRSSAALLVATLITFGLTPALPATAGDEVQPHIVNGSDATIQEAPWQVALMKSVASVGDPSEQFCGGSVLSATWVVTAAHCVDTVRNPDEMWVLAGTATLPPKGDPSVTRHAVDAILIHPSWQSALYNNDVALLRLSSPLPLDGVTIAPIAIPSVATPGFADWPAAGTPALITGWGDTNPNRTQGKPIYATQLQKATVQVLAGPEQERCGDYRIADADTRGYNRVTMLCAGTTTPPLIDSCQGDSGGPLAIQQGGTWYLAGITSWGQDCATPGYPGLYARVTTFAKWIERATQPSYTGSLQVSVPDDYSIGCASLYAATGEGGAVSALCSSGGTTLTLPLVWPGRYRMLTSYLDDYGLESWYSVSGPQESRSEATAITVKAGAVTRVSTTALQGSALRVELPTSALGSVAAGALCARTVSAGGMDQEGEACMASGATSVLVPRIPPGATKVKINNTYPGSPYASGWYAGARLVASEREATEVTTQKGRTSSVSVSLTPGARISGRVTTGGSPDNVLLTLGAAGEGGTLDLRQADETGAYEFSSLLPGTYLIAGEDGSGLGLPQWWDGASTADQATPITVSEGGVVTGIDLALPAAGGIVGTITGPGGAALSPESVLSVTAWRGDTAVATAPVDLASGIYYVGPMLPGGVRLQVTDASGIYAPAWFGGGTGTQVDVVGGNYLQGFDIALALAPRIAVEGTRQGGRVVVSGEVAAFEATTVTPWVRLRGARDFTAGEPVAVRADGTFRWTLTTRKAVSVYFTAGDVTSKRVRVPAR